MTFDKFEEADRDKTRVEIESDTCATEISAAMHGSQQYRYQSSIDHGLQSSSARVRRQLQTRNLHFAVRPVPKVRYSEAFQEWICLDYFFSPGPTRCVGICHNEGSVGILHCR
jgi:hypothetical protein